MKSTEVIQKQIAVFKKLYSTYLWNRLLVAYNSSSKVSNTRLDSIVNSFLWKDVNDIDWRNINDLLIEYNGMFSTDSFFSKDLNKVFQKEIDILKQENPELFL